MRPPPEPISQPVDAPLSAADARRLRHLRRRGAAAAQTLATCEAYWSRSLAAAYLDLLDDVAADEPKVAAAMAEGAAVVIDRARFARDDPWLSDEEYKTYAAYGSAVRASCCRMAGDLRAADSAMNQAVELVEAGGVALWAQGEVLRRRAILLAHVAESARSLEDARKAIELCQLAQFKAGLADSLVLLGVLLFAAGNSTEASECYVSALHLVSGKDSRSERTRCAIITNLGHALSDCGDVRQLKQAALALRAELKKTRQKEHRGKILWGIGRIELRMGASRAAARRFKSAVKHLAESSDPTLFDLAEDCVRAREGFESHDLEEVLSLLERSAVGNRLPEAVKAWDRLAMDRSRQATARRS